MVDFRSWVDASFRRESEPYTSALIRLSGESGISYKALFYAYRGSRVQPDTAERLVAFSGGAVDGAALVMAPTRAEVKATREADEERAKPTGTGGE